MLNYITANQSLTYQFPSTATPTVNLKVEQSYSLTRPNLFKNIYYFGSSNRIKKFEVTTIPPYETRDLLEFTKTYPNQKIIQLQSVSDVRISIDNRSFYYTYAEVKKSLNVYSQWPNKGILHGSTLSRCHNWVSAGNITF